MIKYFRNFYIFYGIVAVLSIFFLAMSIINGFSPKDFDTINHKIRTFDEMLMGFVLLCYIICEGVNRLVGHSKIYYRNYNRKKLFSYKQLTFALFLSSYIFFVVVKICFGANALFVAKHLLLLVPILVVMIYGNLTTTKRFAIYFIFLFYILVIVISVLESIGNEISKNVLSIILLSIEGALLLGYLTSIYFAYKNKVKVYIM